VFQQLLVETLVLACAGGAAGLLLARVTLQGGASVLAANQVPRADEIAIDAPVLLFALALSLLTGILAGAVPAFRAGRADLNESLKEGGRGDAALVAVRTRRMLIVCEVALSVMLLMGAGLMMRTLSALRSVDAGYDATNVLTMTTQLPARRYSTPSQISAYYRTALDKVRALPGVESAGVIDDLPAHGGSIQPIVLEGHAELLPRDQPTVEVRKITPGYLKTMRIPVLRGRDVANNDIDAMLVSRSAAKLLWGDGDPIGTRVTLPLESKTQQHTIVGIVGDVKQGELSEAAGPSVYQFTQENDWRGMNFAIRTAVPPLSIAPSAVAALRSIDTEQPIEQVRTMQAVLDDTLTSQRFSALLLGIFAAVALVLASVGIFSVLSYIVRGRSREIGIRTALGAGTADVVRLVIAEGMMPALAGIIAGALGVLASAKLLQRIVYGVSGADPLTLAAVSITLALVALAASLVPAYRACRVDPLTVLRAE
jgi:predicted permease